MLSARFGEADADDGRLCIGLVKALADLSAADGAELVVVDWRGPDDDAIAAAMSDALRFAPVVEARSLFALDDPRYRFPHDGHPTAAALDLVAAELAKRYGPMLTMR
jgi:hypothetical protein